MSLNSRLNTALGVTLACIVCIEAAIIHEGDVLEIAVQGHPEFSGTYEVNDDGTVEYPLLVEEIVANVATSELMHALTLRLATYVDNPLVTVSIVKNPELTVLVLGQIADPGPVSVYEGVTLQEVFTKAGGPTKLADLKRVKIVPADGTNEDARFYNFEKFFEEGNLDVLPKLKEGDRIVLLSRERSLKVKVIGAVRKPGFYEPEEDVNIFEMIYLAGGPAEKADLSRVRRLFKHEGKTMEEVVDVRSYIDEGDMDKIPMVEEADVIIVYSKWFDWKTVLTILNNTLLFIVTIQTFSGVFN